MNYPIRRPRCRADKASFDYQLGLRHRQRRASPAASPSSLKRLPRRCAAPAARQIRSPKITTSSSASQNGSFNTNFTHAEARWCRSTTSASTAPTSTVASGTPGPTPGSWSASSAGSTTALQRRQHRSGADADAGLRRLHVVSLTVKDSCRPCIDTTTVTIHVASTRRCAHRADLKHQTAAISICTTRTSRRAAQARALRRTEATPTVPTTTTSTTWLGRKPRPRRSRRRTGRENITAGHARRRQPYQVWVLLLQRQPRRGRRAAELAVDRLTVNVYFKGVLSGEDLRADRRLSDRRSAWNASPTSLSCARRRRRQFAVTAGVDPRRSAAAVILCTSTISDTCRYRYLCSRATLERCRKS